MEFPGLAEERGDVRGVLSEALWAGVDIGIDEKPWGGAGDVGGSQTRIQLGREVIGHKVPSTVTRGGVGGQFKRLQRVRLWYTWSDMRLTKLLGLCGKRN